MPHWHWAPISWHFPKSCFSSETYLNLLSLSCFSHPRQSVWLVVSACFPDVGAWYSQSWAVGRSSLICLFHVLRCLFLSLIKHDPWFSPSISCVSSWSLSPISYLLFSWCLSLIWPIVFFHYFYSDCSSISTLQVPQPWQSTSASFSKLRILWDFYLTSPILLHPRQGATAKYTSHTFWHHSNFYQ